MKLKSHLIFTLYTIYGILLKVMASKGKVRGISGQYPLVQNVTVTEGGTANLTCRVEFNDNTSLQWSNPAQQTLFFGDKKALRDNRIELVRATSSELTISISDVTLSDEGMYTCSLFTMPVRTAKAYLTVLGVPEKPEIDGLTKPAMEGDHITLTCITQGSKPAADLRWFRNEKEVKGAKEVNASGKTFTVRSSLQLQVDRNDDGVAYTCRVDHVALTQAPQQATEVLEVHYAPRVEITRSLEVPQEGQYLKLECVSKGNPSPDPVMWTKDGSELPDLDRMIVEGRELTFTSLNKTDNGTYRCEASNHLGTSSAEYVLYVYDAPTTLPPPTTPPLHPIPPDPTALLGSHASDPTVTGNRDPNALGQHGTDHALIGGVVAVVVFVTLCLIIVLGRYLARHKGTYLTNEAKGADDAPDADTAIINAEGNHAHAEEKKEYFI
ncbi:cell adhesion molecule 2a isoform X1 [Neolamprologus brichardi]|uniref:cell adhesion molecule 2a isoform X1 n=1 Tax=Neolamprologus brichardi TaxID=32507 RepID=UPI0003EC3048|nr:cell adhesion molecule 2a isoform X1 [Neolamprologus brichardi]